MGMPHDHFADDLNWSGGSGGGRKILLFNHLGDLLCVRVTSAKSL